jgi:hypothetical protein
MKSVAGDRGAASLTRWLGCAPTRVARVRPRHWCFPARIPDSQMSSVSLLGRMDRCSELTSGAAPRTPRDSHLGSALDSNRTGPTDAGSDEELTTGGFTTELVCGFPRSLTKCA